MLDLIRTYDEASKHRGCAWYGDRLCRKIKSSVVEVAVTTRPGTQYTRKSRKKQFLYVNMYGEAMARILKRKGSVQDITSQCLDMHRRHSRLRLGVPGVGRDLRWAATGPNDR